MTLENVYEEATLEAEAEADLEPPKEPSIAEEPGPVEPPTSPTLGSRTLGTSGASAESSADCVARAGAAPLAVGRPRGASASVGRLHDAAAEPRSGLAQVARSSKLIVH